MDPEQPEPLWSQNILLKVTIDALAADRAVDMLGNQVEKRKDFIKHMQRPQTMVSLNIIRQKMKG